MGVPARRSVLGRGQVAQRSVTVSVIMVMLVVADHHSGFAQAGPVVAVQALLTEPVVERFDISVVPGAPGAPMPQWCL